MDKPDTAVTYDDDDACWVARDHGAELARNHRIGPGEVLAAHQWLAWLTGEEVPMEPGHREYLDNMKDLPTTIGPGLGSRLMLELLAQNSPGHRTDEFELRPLDIIWAQACTSLNDEAALARARTCPSGTSGGWIRSDDPGHAPVPCSERPNTHRHLMFVSG